MHIIFKRVSKFYSLYIYKQLFVYYNPTSVEKKSYLIRKLNIKQIGNLNISII